jgi:MFS family permease
MTAELDPHAVSEVRTRLLRQREFGLLFWGQAVSSFGDRLVMVAMPFAVLSIPGADLSDVGLVLGATTLSLAVFVLVGGVVADRIPRQLTMLGSDVVRAAAQGLTAYLLLTDRATVLSLVVLQSVYGAAEAFFRPAVLGLVPQVVTKLDIQPAQALLALSANIALLTGPVAAGLLVAGVGAGGAIAVDALTFLVSAATLARMRPTPGERAQGGSFVKDLAGGWREVASRSWVWAILLAFSAYHALVLPALFVLGPLYAETDRGGATSWGVISAGFGIGSLVGSLVALRVRVDRTGLVIGAALAVSCSQAVIVVLPIPTLAVAALEAVTGITVALCFTLWETALNLRIPAAAQSRVSSFDYLASLTLMPIGYVAIGPVAEALGTQRTALLATAVTATVCVAITLVPGVRRLREG